MKKLISTLVLSAMVAGAGVSFAYDDTTVTGGGNIQGHVKFTGTMPKLDALVVQKNQDFCGNTKPNEALIVGKDGGVKNAIGYLDNITKGKAIDRNAVLKMAEAKCMFTPHVFAVYKAEKIELNNEDPILHNVNVMVDGIQRFNKGQPKQNQVLQVVLRNPGVADITCDSHTHMRGYALILQHPYFAVSDDAGNFTIDNIPAGKYTLKVWHENWTNSKGKDDDGRILYDAPKEISKEVEVKGGATAKVEFDLK
jgi:plastocyanin